MLTEKHSTKILGWADAIEMTGESFDIERAKMDPERVQKYPEGAQAADLYVCNSNGFLLLVASTPEGAFPQWLDVRPGLTDPDGILIEAARLARYPSENAYVSDNESLFIIPKPKPGTWDIRIDSDPTMPFSVNAVSFHPGIDLWQLRSANSLLTSSLRWANLGVVKCSGCKITLKAVALAIAAVLSSSMIPHAVILIVAHLLGVTDAVAKLFIVSLIGYSVDEILQIICKRIGLCQN